MIKRIISHIILFVFTFTPLESHAIHNGVENGSFLTGFTTLAWSCPNGIAMPDSSHLAQVRGAEDEDIYRALGGTPHHKKPNERTPWDDKPGRAFRRPPDGKPRMPNNDYTTPEVNKITLDTVRTRLESRDYLSAYLVVLYREEFLEDFPEGEVEHVRAKIPKALQGAVSRIDKFYEDLGYAITDMEELEQIIMYAESVLRGTNKDDVDDAMFMVEGILIPGDTAYEDLELTMRLFESCRNLFGQGLSHKQLRNIIDHSWQSFPVDYYSNVFSVARQLKERGILTEEMLYLLVDYFHIFMNWSQGLPDSVAADLKGMENELVFGLFSAKPMADLYFLKQLLLEMVEKFTMTPKTLIAIFQLLTTSPCKAMETFSKLVHIYFQQIAGEFNEVRLAKLLDLESTLGVTRPETSLAPDDFVYHCTPAENAARLLVSSVIKSEAALIEESRTVVAGDTGSTYSSLEEKRKLPRYSDTIDDVVLDDQVYYSMRGFAEDYTDEVFACGIAIPIESLSDSVQRQIAISKDQLDENEIDESSTGSFMPLDRAIFFVDSQYRGKLIDELKEQLHAEGVPEDKIEDRLKVFMGKVIFFDITLNLNTLFTQLLESASGTTLLSRICLAGPSKGLTPPAAGSTEDLDGLPPYTGAGGTAIHTALAEAKAKINQGQHDEARKILRKLIADLDTVEQNGNIPWLMGYWNERYLSNTEVDLLFEHILDAVREAEALLRSIAQPTDELIMRRGKPIVFSTRQNSTQKYEIVVQEDFIERDIIVARDKIPDYMICVQTVPQREDEIAYPVGMATGLSMDEDGAMNLGWINVLDYKGIFEEMEEFRPICGERVPLIDVMLLYVAFKPKAEYAAQMKFLYAYLTSKLKIETDDEVRNFFENAPQNLRTKGIGNAIAEFVTSFAPVGSRLAVSAFHKRSRQSLEAGERFERTRLSQWCVRLGYEVIQQSEADGREIPTVILEKKLIPASKVNWDQPKDLGEYCL